MIGVRVDANDEISIGHLMRCLSIADEVSELKRDLIFITSEYDTYQTILSKGYKGICLSNNYKDKNKEIGQVESIVEKENINCLLLDSYEITREYMNVLSKKTSLVYIDDIRKFNYIANTVINYSPDAKEWRYDTSNIGELLLGSKFTPIRKDFRNIKRTRDSKIKSLFVSAGALDEYKMVLSIIDAILKEPNFKDIKIYAVAGRYYKNYKELLAYCKGYRDRVELYRDINDIWSVMDRADLAISASGTTVSELCSIGIPTINFVVADNQKNGARALKNENVVVYAGDVREDIERVLVNIIKALNSFRTGSLDYTYFSNQGMNIYDGLGARRIAERLISLDK